ncbi:hypothetical protein JYK14_07845 [Siccirubricoccus sp. KC 17139]|uniref:Uncharacterized protein n=1 Tax=Siccirubricoccus soli TaxID=2899147 RepID=A0ABT1D2F9_9PROT|nr:hypothetical protein [Siccirubricoccus soli]MCO6416082.1 hypothetical protein [Siccirubricoccus soli]MCP2682214.1 hypothetical protein [Siccirubricoccus soli]
MSKPKKTGTAAPSRDPKQPVDETGSDDLEAVLAKEGSEDPMERKEFHDLRDRAAYVAVTGAFPTHLRPHSVRLLRQAVEYSRTPTAIDGDSGALTVRPDVRRRLRLDEHPMVVAAKRFVAEGYRIAVAREPTARRPFGRAWLYLPLDETRAVRVTVHANGAAAEGWA